MKIKFSDVATFIAGQSPESKYYSKQDGVPFMQGNKTFGTFYPTVDTYTSKVTKMARQGAILMSVRAPVGDLNFAPCDLCIGRGLTAINAKNGDNAFLFYALKYNLKVLLNQSNGTTYDSITGDDLRDMVMIVPDDSNSYPYISKLLRTIDEKIENNTTICADLDGMAKLLYDYWFVQFDFPDENGKPYKSSGGKMVWNEELKREIPEGWEVKPLKGLYLIERGLSYTSRDISSGEGIPMINLACIDRSRYYRDGELKYYNGKISDDAFLKAGDLLIACTDLTREREILGCPILVPDDGNKYVYSTDLAKISFPSSQLNDLYMYMTLRTDFYHEYIKAWASGTTVLHLNLQGLDWYNICIPPAFLQDRFAEVISVTHSKKSEILVENQQLASLRDFLLPMLMNGQVKVRKGEA